LDNKVFERICVFRGASALLWRRQLHNTFRRRTVFCYWNIWEHVQCETIKTGDKWRVGTQAVNAANRWDNRDRKNQFRSIVWTSVWSRQPK